MRAVVPGPRAAACAWALVLWAWLTWPQQGSRTMCPWSRARGCSDCLPRCLRQLAVYIKAAYMYRSHNSVGHQFLQNGGRSAVFVFATNERVVMCRAYLVQLMILGSTRSSQQWCSDSSGHCRHGSSSTALQPAVNDHAKLYNAPERRRAVYAPVSTSRGRCQQHGGYIMMIRAFRWCAYWQWACRAGCHLATDVFTGGGGGSGEATAQ